MNLKFFKYQGSGNDFIMLDNREKLIKLNEKNIKFLCNRHFGIGADGLIILQNDTISDFYMQYFNANGIEGSMCGNGGRAIIKFASDLKIIHKISTFRAIDGLHEGRIVDNYIELKMIDIKEIKKNDNHYILDTGSPHYVKFVNNLQKYKVYENGKKIRYSKNFPQGINVNFVEKIFDNILFVRTYERGVENETLSCGTGITASALAYAYQNSIQNNNINVKSLGGNLCVKFKRTNNLFYDIYLKGDVKFVFQGKIQI